MKRHSHQRILSILTVLVMLFTLIPATSTAASNGCGLSYTLPTVDGGSVSTAPTGKPKVLFFYMTTCGNCSYMLSQYQSYGGVSGVDFVVAEFNYASQSAAASYAARYSIPGATWCYDANTAGWRYANKVGIHGTLTSPLVIYLDKDNNIVESSTGYVYNFPQHVAQVFASSTSSGNTNTGSHNENHDSDHSGTTTTGNSGTGTTTTGNHSSHNEICVYLRGSKISFDVQPEINNERTMVPMRAIFKAYGMEVEWNQADRSIYAYNDNNWVWMQIDNPGLYLNGKCVYTMDSAPYISGSRTLVPVRAISEALNMNVTWDDATRSVHIEDYCEGENCETSR